MAILERVSDEHGSVVLGWAHAGVFYARFERSISLGIAQRFARRFVALIGDNIRVRYFGDSSAVISYDPQAMGAVATAMLSKRQRFDSIIVRPWRGVMGAQANAFADAFGCLEYVTSAVEFEQRFRSVAPDAGILPPRDEPSDEVESGRPSSPGDVVDARGGDGASRDPDGLGYSYVFDLSDFERGRFTATRSEHLGERSRSGWVCVARDDEQALVLARQAALVEWAKPSSRRPDDFTVKFCCNHLSRELPFDRRQ